MLTLLASPIGAGSYRVATRADWRSLDLLCRRLEYIRTSTEDATIRRCARIALLHLVPMRDRHGGVHRPNRAIPIDAYDLAGAREATLIMQQHGHAGVAGHMADLLDHFGDATLGRLRRWAIRAAWASLPWAIVLTLGWIVVARRGRHYRRALEGAFRGVRAHVLDRDVRHAIGADPDTAEEYQRAKRRGAITAAERAQ